MIQNRYRAKNGKTYRANKASGTIQHLIKLKILGLIQNSGNTYLFISSSDDSKLGTKNMVNGENLTNKKTLQQYRAGIDIEFIKIPLYSF